MWNGWQPEPDYFVWVISMCLFIFHLSVYFMRGDFNRSSLLKTFPMFIVIATQLIRKISYNFPIETRIWQLK